MAVLRRRHHRPDATPPIWYADPRDDAEDHVFSRYAWTTLAIDANAPRQLLAAAWSASSMWTANAATVKQNFQTIARAFITDRGASDIILRALQREELSPAEKLSAYAWFFDLLNRQDRNVHDLTRDLAAEFVGYEVTEKLLERLKDDPMAIFDFMPERAAWSYREYRKHFE